VDWLEAPVKLGAALQGRRDGDSGCLRHKWKFATNTPEIVPGAALPYGDGSGFNL
jgi:hypothetical protein